MHPFDVERDLERPARIGLGPCPCAYTLVKQPFDDVQAGSENAVLNTPRSDSIFGSSYASTIATTIPSPWFAIASNPYACRASAGVRPAIVAVLARGFVWNGGRANPFGARLPST